MDMWVEVKAHPTKQCIAVETTTDGSIPGARIHSCHQCKMCNRYGALSDDEEAMATVGFTRPGWNGT